ncbi:MAG: hypothetical protein DMG36_11090 [Acidobacteria bacterium]|nr:MAG: hypothetical protein DMG36_11090 [Acidobacteriota bacterium]
MVINLIRNCSESFNPLNQGNSSTPPSSWYSCDAFARFLEADIRETAGGNEEELIKRAEAVIERLLSGIYKMVRQAGLAGGCHPQDRRWALHLFRRRANHARDEGNKQRNDPVCRIFSQPPDYGICDHWFL